MDSVTCRNVHNVKLEKKNETQALYLIIQTYCSKKAECN